MAGLALAAGAPDGKGVTAIETRAAIDKTASAEAVDALARQNVVAIVGPIKGSSVDEAAARAESLGVPLISLATNADLRKSSRFVFRISVQRCTCMFQPRYFPPASATTSAVCDALTATWCSKPLSQM